MVTNASEFLTNPCNFLTKLTKSAEFRENHSSIRIYCDAYENNKNMLSKRILGTGS